MKKLLFSALVFISASTFAQDTTKKEAPKVSFKPLGSITISAHQHNDTSLISTFLNFGGPGIRFEYGKFAVSYSMFPSLRFYETTTAGKKELTANPILGTGLAFHYKKFTVALPMYYLASPRTKKNIWIVSAGIGYKL